MTTLLQKSRKSQAKSYSINFLLPKLLMGNEKKIKVFFMLCGGKCSKNQFSCKNVA